MPHYPVEAELGWLGIHPPLLDPIAPESGREHDLTLPGVPLASSFFHFFGEWEMALVEKKRLTGWLPQKFLGFGEWGMVEN